MRSFLAVFVLAVVSLGSFACRDRATTSARMVPATVPGNLRQATFSAGCFWSVEEAFRHLPGVTNSVVGYSGGKTQSPTYAQVCTDLTGHAESVLVTYDPTRISYPELLDAFWSCHDPTTLNRQGPDVGTQYRSIIFCHDAEQEKDARTSAQQAARFFDGKIVTEIRPAVTFYPAEEYHQQYLMKNGGFCHTGPVTVHTTLAEEAARARGATPRTVGTPAPR